MFLLAEVRWEAGDGMGAEAPIRETADSGSLSALIRLAEMRDRASDEAGDEALARQLVDHGEAGAPYQLIDLPRMLENGALWASGASGPPEWTLDSLPAAARAEGMAAGRSQVRRSLLLQGGALAPYPVLDAVERPGLRPKGTRTVGSYIQPPDDVTVSGTRLEVGLLCP
ncbi:hypothetical protein ACFC00_18785 [Streptomyces adustus]|uniref:hypothetical protein n=1 Tax=Streptomyces adustus TaxID=1609272 RepID=UPI0035D70EC6